MLAWLKRYLTSFEHGVIVAFVLGFAYLQLYTLPDYGVMWDTWELYLGDKNLYAWLQRDPGTLDPRRDDIPLYHTRAHPNFHDITNAYHDNDAILYPHLIWPFGPLTSSASKWLLHARLGWLDPFDAHHAVLVLWAAALFLALYRFALPELGVWTGLAAVLCIGTYPRFWAELHSNVKDVPAAVLFAGVIFAFVRAVERDRWGLMLLAAGLWGLGLATKANGLFLPFILVPWLLLIWFQRWRGGRPVVSAPLGAAMLAFAPLGLGVMLAAWPLLLVDFPRYLTLYLTSLRARGFGGAPHWQVEPLLQGLYTMPEPVLGLLAIGLLALLWRCVRARGVDPLALLLLLWLAVPVGRVCLPGAKDFDGIRHWLEVVPAIGLIAGYGASRVLAVLTKGWQRLPKRWQAAAGRYGLHRALWLALVLAAFAPVVWWDAQHHPNQICYYNRLIGGLAGARARGLTDATDYWANSYRQGFDWLNANAPPGAGVLLGVAEHIGFYTAPVWLRGDLELLPLVGRGPADVQGYLARHDGNVYLMYVIRPGWYHALVREVDGRLRPVHEIAVDGAPILRILRLGDVRAAAPAAVVAPAPAP